ncbi:hypothetical protein OROGR_023366 [Orobanche gracilis]
MTKHAITLKTAASLGVIGEAMQNGELYVQITIHVMGIFTKGTCS